MGIFLFKEIDFAFAGQRNEPLPKLHFIPENKEFLCITHTVKHNYISPSSTVGIQLHVSALYFGYLQVVI